MSKVLKLMCGIPGSGKSTWIREHVSPDTKVISRDEIRFAILKDNDNYFSKEKEVWKEFIKQIKNAIAEYNDVIVDATHLNEASRKKVLNALSDVLNADISVCAIFMATPLEVALDYNANRTGREFVPESVIRNMFSICTMPRFEEGFEKVCVVFADGEIKVLEASND